MGALYLAPQPRHGRRFWLHVLDEYANAADQSSVPSPGHAIRLQRTPVSERMRLAKGYVCWPLRANHPSLKRCRGESYSRAVVRYLVNRLLDNSYPTPPDLSRVGDG
eukprot:270155-Pleurochrysis_carterae.AAC.1